MIQWISATIAVLALFLLAARGLRFVLERSRRQGGNVLQVGAWRVAPDASVRAVRAFGRVHLLYERGRESVLLETLEGGEFELRSSTPTLEPVRRAASPVTLARPRAQVAKA